MKCISLWQPWASAIASGAKTIETRGWSTNYRGPLAIHAAQRKNIGELIHFHSDWGWCEALSPLGVKMGQREGLDTILPFGAVIAVCELVACTPTEKLPYGDLCTPKKFRADATFCFTEHMLGDFSNGRFGWVLNNVRVLPKPVPFKGKQGFFEVPNYLLEVEAAS